MSFQSLLDFSNPWLTTLFLCVALSALLYLLHLKESTTSFIFKKTPFNQSFKDLVTQTPFSPTFYLPSAWLKMVVGLLRDEKDMSFDRQIFEFPDGGQVATDWYPKDFEDTSAPVLIVVPGLNGETSDQYVKYTCKKAFQENGYRSVVYNRRGHCGIELKGNHLFPWVVLEDMDHYIEHIRQKYPLAKIYALGFSMGANFIQYYCGERGKENKPTRLEAVATVSCPNSIRHGSHKLLNNSLLNKFIVESCKKVILTNKSSQLVQDTFKRLNISEEKLRKMNCIRQFDHEFTARVLGHSSNDAYYDAISGVYRLEHVKTPMCSFSSKCDPLIEFSEIDKQKTESNENIFQVIVNNGGHIEYSHGFYNDNWAVLTGLKFLKYVSSQRI